MNTRVTGPAGRQAPAKGSTPEKTRVTREKPSPTPRKPSAAASTSTRPNSGVGPGPAFIEPGQRRAMIAEAAYFRAERRGFEPGRELEDWCLAEGDIDGLLTRSDSGVAAKVAPT